MGTLWFKTKLSDPNYELDENMIALMYSIEIYGSDQSTIIDACSNYEFYKAH